MTASRVRRAPSAKKLGRRCPSQLSGRTSAVVAVIALGLALAGVLVATTPWQTLPEPVPGGPEPVDASRDFTAEQMAREDAYHGEIRPLSYASLAVSLALAVVLGVTPLGARLVALAGRPMSRRGSKPDRATSGGDGVPEAGHENARDTLPRLDVWLGQIALGAVAITLLGRLVTLPFSVRAEVVQRDYGLSTQTWGTWAIDVLKGFGIDLALVLVVLLGLFTLARWLPRWWWAPAAALGALLVLVVSYIVPVVIQPVYNTFTPMEPGPLKSSLLDLARDDGLDVKEVLIADASRRTTRLNAYVSGYGSTRRIVIYDTTLREMSPEEIRLLTAHELGHVKHNDVLYGTLVGALAMSAAVCVVYLVVTSPTAQRRAGVRSVADPRALALVLAVIAVLTTVTGPLGNLVSRRIEARADVHSLELTRDPATLIEMQQRLAATNISDLDPNPVLYGFFRSHPTAPERIALARDWAKINNVPIP